MKIKTIKIVTATSLFSGNPLAKEVYLGELEACMDWKRGFLTKSILDKKNVLIELKNLLENYGSNYVTGFDGEKPDPTYAKHVKQLNAMVKKVSALKNDVFIDVEN